MQDQDQSTLVTADDHDHGTKTITVFSRNGKRSSVVLVAPSYRQAQKLTMEIQTTKDVLCVSAAALRMEKVLAEKYLDSLTLASASLVETVAFALTFGTEFQKKMEKLGTEFLQAASSTASNSSGANSKLLLPDLDPNKCVSIRCPSCNSGIDLLGNERFSAISGQPTSPPSPE